MTVGYETYAGTCSSMSIISEIIEETQIKSHCWSLVYMIEGRLRLEFSFQTEFYKTIVHFFQVYRNRAGTGAVSPCTAWLGPARSEELVE